MARTYIGVDVDQNRLHVVCLEQGGEGLFVRAIASREVEDGDQAAEAVAGIIEDWGVDTTRMAAALSPEHLLFRSVRFPFADTRKIAATVPLELASTLPVDLEGYLTAVMPAGRDGDLYRYNALAVPEADVVRFLAGFDREQLPLRILGVAPFTDLQALPVEVSDALLVTIRTAGYSVVRVEAGLMQSYRQTPLAESLSDEELAAQILRDVRTLAAQVPESALPVYLLGAGLTVARQRVLIEKLPGATVPDVAFEAGRLQAAYLPALALARLAALPERKAYCNLRRGAYVFRGSLTPYRRQLVAIAVLLTLSLAATVSGFWFSYARKASDLARLDQTLRGIYTQSFPGAAVPKDVPSFLTSNLAGLRKESRLLGTAQTAPLPVLEAMTAGVGSDAGIEVQDFSFNAEGSTLSGRADSFDAVDRLAARLRQQPVFAQVQIGDAKMSIDGSRVDFRVDASFEAAGGEP